MTDANAQNCRCECGSVVFSATGPALFRVLCHCTICQTFNNAAMADVVVFRAASIKLPAESLVDYDTYKPPPNVQRGKCRACQKPAVELFRAPLFPQLVMVPSENIHDDSLKPAPAMHLFYQHRQREHDDQWPKYNGFVGSQLAFGKQLLGAMLRR